MDGNPQSLDSKMHLQLPAISKTFSSKKSTQAPIRRLDHSIFRKQRWIANTNES